MSKKTLSILLILIIAFCNTVSAFADETPKFYGDNVKCKSGDTVEYSVNISDNPGIAACLVGVVCESDWFYFDDDAKQGNFSSEGSITTSNDVSYLNVTWFNADDVKGDGTLFTFKIHVSPGTPTGEYPIKVMYSKENTIDSKCNEIEFQTADGVIEVEHTDTPQDWYKDTGGEIDSGEDTNPAASDANGASSSGNGLLSKIFGESGNKQTEDDSASKAPIGKIVIIPVIAAAVIVATLLIVKRGKKVPDAPDKDGISGTEEGDKK